MATTPVLAGKRMIETGRTEFQSLLLLAENSAQQK